jgi:hypothetical protein
MRFRDIVGSRLAATAGALFLLASCATAPRQPEAASARVKDSAHEKLAAQRAAAPHSLTLEQDEERWGFEAARERKRRQDEEKARRPPAPGDKALHVTTPTAR